MPVSILVCQSFISFMSKIILLPLQSCQPDPGCFDTAALVPESPVEQDAQQCLHKCMILGRELIPVLTPCAVSQLRNCFKHYPMWISASPISSASLWCFRRSFDSAQMQSNKFITLLCGTFAPKFIAVRLTGEQPSHHQPASLLLPCVSVVIRFFFFGKTLY